MSELVTYERGGSTVVSTTHVDNHSSIRLLQRLGFTLSSQYDTEFKGEPCTEQVYLINTGETSR